MKVIEGNFGKEKEARKPGELLREQLDKFELDDLPDDAQYLLLVDTGSSLAMISNLDRPGEVLMMAEKAKTAVMMTQFGGPGMNGGGDAA